MSVERSFVRPTARDYVAAFRAETTTPSEVVERILAAIRGYDESDTPLSAFISLERDLIRREARESTQRYRRGESLGPLDGVPVAIKDEFDVAGYRTTAGTAFRREAELATKDSTVAARLREAGAIRLGKTNMHEVGLGGTGLNPHYGTARNPYDPTRIPGGSSSGSAVAVAAGLCPLALGSDAGGSIRIPAALCGVTGLKPTYGRIPATGGSLLAWSLDHLGPIGASVADLHAFLRATAGPDGHDPAATAQPSVGPLEPVTDLSILRFAYSPTFGMDGEPALVALFQGMIRHLRAAGATVESVELEWHREIQKVGYLTLASEGAASQRSALARHRTAFGNDVRLLLSVGSKVTAVEYIHAQRIRRLIREELVDLTGRYDAFIHPTCASVASPIAADAAKSGEVDDEVNAPLSAYTFAGNLSGLPSVSIPIGTIARDGRLLPVGMQLMGGAWKESRLLSVAAALETHKPMPRPMIYFDPLA